MDLILLGIPSANKHEYIIFLGDLGKKKTPKKRPTIFVIVLNLFSFENLLVLLESIFNVLR